MVYDSLRQFHLPSRPRELPPYRLSQPLLNSLTRLLAMAESYSSYSVDIRRHVTGDFAVEPASDY